MLTSFNPSGQLCTDLEVTPILFYQVLRHADEVLQEVIQAAYHQQIFAALIPTLEAPEARYVKSRSPYQSSIY